MKIECPHCKTDNEYSTIELTCEKCKKNYKGIHFSKKTLFPIITAAILTGGAVHYFEPKSSNARYPQALEYSIADTCINGSKNHLSEQQYVQKRDKCLCALKATQRLISYSDLEKNEKSFVTAFKSSLDKCN